MEPVKPKTQKIVEHIPEDIGNNTPTDGFQTNGSEERTCSSRGGSINNSKKFRVEIISPRLYLMDRRLHKYRLVFEPKVPLNKCYITISLSGEQSNIPVILRSAIEPDTGRYLNFNNNKIFLISYQRKNKS